MDKFWLSVIGIVGITIPVAMLWNVVGKFIGAVLNYFSGRAIDKLVLRHRDGSLIGVVDVRNIATEDPEKLLRLIAAVRKAKSDPEPAC